MQLKIKPRKRGFYFAAIFRKIAAIFLLNFLLIKFGIKYAMLYHQIRTRRAQIFQRFFLRRTERRRVPYLKRISTTDE